MYVCVCQKITDREIRQAVANGARSLHSLREQLPLGGCCGRCLPYASELVAEHSVHQRQLGADCCAPSVQAA
jgi:bacterioferritin-associated ferredoxin